MKLINKLHNITNEISIFLLFKKSYKIMNINPGKNNSIKSGSMYIKSLMSILITPCLSSFVEFL